ncbi:MAG TPA: lysylphosphatidylglycerol synthase transmembrane domain-containing protein [Alphaproteobacteria bacterium]|nr:flippase-like domain-containing protein [Micavibrio sp.]MBK9561882.1 flippase-like domain-containing protein [Micavibrio sp.]HQX27335.1 lysylphosphatidylglycerol synthase transmembrane domain-containing protein [Alphaproteobacteria bacterium]
MLAKSSQKSAINKPLLWGVSLVISLGLLALVIMQVDVGQAASMFQNISSVLLGVAFVFLVMEGIATALRLWLFAGKRPCMSEALKANAWYVLLLVILPARLGEVAAVVVLERYLGQKYGAAAMSIIMQRLYDMIVLGTIFLIALLGLGDFVDKTFMSIASLALIGFVLFVLVRLEFFLTIAAVIFKKAPKKLYRLILQARLYSRHGFKIRDIPLALLFTFIKWVSNLAALVFLFMSLHLGLGMFENITVAAAYNFLAIIPLQTIGGIGIGEAGLALLFTGTGLDVSTAASASLMIRFVILIFPFIFWVMVMGGLNLKKRLSI